VNTPDDRARKGGKSIFTRLSHAGRAGTHIHGFVNPPVHRGSTVLQPKLPPAARARASGWNNTFPTAFPARRRTGR
jgi:cystathionine beta-lyase